MKHVKIDVRAEKVRSQININIDKIDILTKRFY